MHGAMVRNWFKLALELTVGLVGILYIHHRKNANKYRQCVQQVVLPFSWANTNIQQKRRASAGGCSCIIKAEKQKRGETKRQTRRNKQKNRRQRSTMTETKKTKRNFNK